MRLYIVESQIITLTVIARNASHAVMLAVEAIGRIPGYVVARPL